MYIYIIYVYIYIYHLYIYISFIYIYRSFRYIYIFTYTKYVIYIYIIFLLYLYILYIYDRCSFILYIPVLGVHHSKHLAHLFDSTGSKFLLVWQSVEIVHLYQKNAIKHPRLTLRTNQSKRLSPARSFLKFQF